MHSWGSSLDPAVKGRGSITGPHPSPKAVTMKKPLRDADVVQCGSAVAAAGAHPEPSSNPYGKATAFVQEEWRTTWGPAQ